MQPKEKNKMEITSKTKTEIVIDNGTSEETIETSIDLPELNLVVWISKCYCNTLYSLKIKEEKLINLSDIN